MRNEEGLTCKIESVAADGTYRGIVKYNGFENGVLTASTAEAVSEMFQIISELVHEQGAMVRLGCIICGYHNDDLQGDVMHLDGEFLGLWHMDAEDWCFFTVLWMLHDGIGGWLEQQGAE